MTTTIELTSPPSLPRIYATSLLPGLPSWAGGARPVGLPELEVTLPNFRVDQHDLAAYDRVCGLRLSDRLPITYLHILAFPMSMQLMTDSSFPYPIVGLVHLANRMTLHRPVSVNETLSFAVRTDRLRTHKKGMLFDVLAEARVGDELVWTGESSYLRPGKPSEQHVAKDLPSSLPGDSVPMDLAPPEGARVGGRLCHRFRTADAVVPFADSFSRFHAEEQSARRIDVMIFEIDALQPGIVPAEVFRFLERFEQPFLGNPIDSANK